MARGPVKLLLRTATAQADAWHTAFAAAMPEARIATWPELPFDPDYVAVWKPPLELFARVRPPKAIFNLGAGVDALIGLPNLPPGVPVIRLEDAGMAQPMAEYVAHAVLSAHRHANAYGAQQRARVWEALAVVAPGDFHVCVLGLGVLGIAALDALRPFGFALVGWSRRPRSLPGVTTFSGSEGLDAALAGSHALVCLLPSTRDTRNLVDARRMRLLARGGHIVNVARGDLVVDEDLLALLDEGHLGGAMLDVFRTEPLPAAHPFWHHPKVIVTPHVSAVTQIDASVAQVAAKIARLERGETVSGVVDPMHEY